MAATKRTWTKEVRDRNDGRLRVRHCRHRYVRVLRDGQNGHRGLRRADGRVNDSRNDRDPRQERSRLDGVMQPQVTLEAGAILRWIPRPGVQGRAQGTIRRQPAR
jgi:hypothetical protein